MSVAVRRSASTERPVVRARTPEDLLALAPYLLGFHPDESLVLLGLRHHTVELVARIDLPPPEHRAVVVARVADAIRSVDPDEVALITFGARSDDAMATLDAAIEELSDLSVVEAIHADGRRWWSHSCRCERCPADGLPYAVGSHPLAAEAVVAGLGTLPDRATVAGLVVGPADEVTPSLAAEAAQVSRTVGRLSATTRRQLLRRLLRRPAARLSRTELLRLVVLTDDIELRDVAWSRIDRRSASAQLDVWREAVGVAPPDWARAPLCLLAVAAWQDGQGALMVCAFERALELDPTYSMARLLADLNDAAVPPRAWQEVVPELRAELSGGRSRGRARAG